MALAARLEVTFTSDGSFDFAATFEGLAATIGEVELGDVTFDPSAVVDLVSNLDSPDLGAVAGAALDVSGRLVAEIAGVPSPDVVTRALDDALGATASLRALSFDALAAGTAPDVGLPALQGRVRAVTGALEAGPLGELARLAGGVLPDVSLGAHIGRLDSTLGGVVALLTLLGGLVTVDTISARALERAETLRDVVRADVALAAGEELRARAARAGLVAQLRAADPDDASAAETLGREVVRFLDAVHRVGDEWARDLGFGEAIVVGLDLAGSGAGLAAARVALDPSSVPSVAGLAASARGALDGVMSAPLPDPAGSLDAAIQDALGLTGDLTAAVRAYDAGRVTRGIDGMVDGVLAPLRDLAGALGAVGTEVAAAIRSVRQAVDAVDLSPVADAIETVLAPVAAALEAVDGAVAAGADAIEDASAAVVGALTTVRDEVAGAATAVRDALAPVVEAVEAIDFEGLQRDVEQGLGEVANALASAQITPYVDASIDVVDTTADVVGAIPFGMLPTDLQSEIVTAVRPIKEIDFEVIATGLRGELQAIVDALDTDVLAEVDAAFADVVEFLASIDPAEPVRALEEEAYAQLRAAIDALDPAALLAPVEDALERFRGALAGVDVEAEVLGPLDAAFGEVTAVLDRLAPGPLLQGAVDEVAAARAEIEEVLYLDDVAAALDSVRGRAARVLEALDARALAGAVSADLAARLRPSPDDGPGALAELVAGLARAAGLPADATSLPGVLRWLGDVDGRAVVEGRLRLASEHVAGVRTDVRALDPAPLVTAAQAHHRALLDAVRSHPDGALLRRALEPTLEANEPGAILGPLVENRRRLETRLDVEAGVAAALAAPGWSEITAVTDGLRDALAPLASVVTWARGLLARFGIDPGEPLANALGSLLERAGPHRLLPALVDLVDALRAKALELVDAALAPADAAVDAVRGVLDALDLQPVLDELEGLHGDVVAAVESVSPAALLGPTVASVQGLVDRLEAFDPLAAVRAAADALTAAVTETFDTLRPSVLFADVLALHGRAVELASGLNVRLLLAPVLDALEGLRAQLDVGLEEVAAALTRLQAALPDRVTSSGASGSVSVDVGMSL
ncbi:MAG TPA: hypothetical protein VHJ34_01505 [Actinomycetota bacterium]|nr:hypothetical protein [Actinomycetota bacterium]